MLNVIPALTDFVGADPIERTLFDAFGPRIAKYSPCAQLRRGRLLPTGGVVRLFWGFRSAYVAMRIHTLSPFNFLRLTGVRLIWMLAEHEKLMPAGFCGGCSSVPVVPAIL
jgi:hypothetical protein